MSETVTRVCVALPGGVRPAATWLAALEASAGAPLTIVAASDLAAACAEAASDVVVITAELTTGDGWLAALARRPGGLAVGTVGAVTVAAREAAALERVRAGAAAEPAVAGEVTGPCVLLAREALELLGVDGLSGADPAGFARAFVARCAARGLVNLVAAGAVAGGVGGTAVAEHSPAGHAQARARALADGIGVTIDARSLVAGGAGTQVHTLELIRALAGRTRLRLRIVLPPETEPAALAALRALPGLELKTYAEVVNAGIATDVVHRPYQVFNVHDLRLLQRLGRRIVITQQDHLLYRNPAYFASPDAWEDYRAACRIALAWADRTAFFTEHARREALRDELLEPHQAVVAGIGIDRADDLADGGQPPAGLERLSGRPFLLMLGSDLAHKNRPFAIRLLRALRAEQGWAGGLVLAGPRSEHGSTRAEEQRLLAGDQDGVVVLDRVGEPERRWLLERCAAVVFPSVDEGFGLVPFEAARAGVPCLFAAVGAMAETLPGEAARLVPWDAARSAATSVQLLSSGPARDRHLELVTGAAATHGWAETAQRTERIYDEVLATAPRPVAPIVAAEIAHQEAYERFRARTGDDGMSLLGPDGSLPPDMVRPLLGVLSRPPLRRALLGTLRLLYRAGHRSGG